MPESNTALGNEVAGMDEFLEPFRQTPESSGTFSIDLDLARRRMASLARAEPGLIPGNLVQAGVAGGSSKVLMTLTDRVLEVAFCPTWKCWGKDVETYLDRAALLAASLEPGALSWKSSIGEVDILRRKRGAVFRDAAGASIFRCEFQYLGWWDFLSGGGKIRAQLHSYLSNHCRFCPIPVLLDCVPLNGPGCPQYSFQHWLQLQPRTTSPRSRFISSAPMGLNPSQVYIAGESFLGKGPSCVSTVFLDGPEKSDVQVRRLIPDGALQQWAPPQQKTHVVLTSTCERCYQDSMLAYRISEQWEWVDAEPYINLGTNDPGPKRPENAPPLPHIQRQPEHLCATLWLSQTKSSGTGQLLPIRDGLLLEPEALDDLPGVRAIVAVPHLSVDLEGRRVIRDARFEELVASVRRARHPVPGTG